MRYKKETPRAIAKRRVRNHLAVGAAATGGLLAWDLSSQFIFWKYNATEVVTQPETNSEQRWLAIPGLGQHSGQFLTDELHDVLPGAKDYMTLSSRGISAKKVGKALKSYLGKYFSGQRDSHVPAHNVLVHSMGLPTYLMGIEWCLKQGVEVPPIRNLVAISSPMNITHAFREKPARLLARIPYPGGMLSKLGIEFYQRYETERFKLAAMGKSASEAFRTSHKDSSPFLWSSQVRTVVDRNFLPNELFAKVFTPETRVFHLGDDADHVVKIDAARQGLREFLEPYGVQLHLLDTPDEGHANVPGMRKYLRDLFPAKS